MKTSGLKNNQLAALALMMMASGTSPVSDRAVISKTPGHNWQQTMHLRDTTQAPGWMLKPRSQRKRRLIRRRRGCP